MQNTWRFNMFGVPRGLLGWIGGWIMARLAPRTIQWVIDQMDIQPTDALLEVGFGPGIGVQVMAALAYEGSVAGVDASKMMVKQAQKRNAEAIAEGRVELRLGSVAVLPYASDTFDKALAMNNVQLWPDALDGLREIHRVLKPGGLITLSLTGRSGGDPDELPDLLNKAGFDNIRTVREDQGVVVMGTK